MLDLIGIVLFGWIWFPAKWIMTLVVGKTATPLQSSWRLQAGTIIGALVGIALGGLIIFFRARSADPGSWVVGVILLPIGMILGAAIGAIFEMIHILRVKENRRRREEREAKKSKRRRREAHEDNLGA